MGTFLSSISSAQAIALSECVCADLRSDGALLLDLRTGRCYSFNGLGASIIRVLDTTDASDRPTTSFIARSIRDSNPSAPARLEADVNDFLRRLSALGLVLTVRRRGSRQLLADRFMDDAIVARDDTHSEVQPALRRVSSLDYVAAWLCIATCDVALRCGGVRALRCLVSGVPRRPSRTCSLARAEALGEALDIAAAYYTNIRGACIAPPQRRVSCVYVVYRRARLLVTERCRSSHMHGCNAAIMS